MNLNVNSADWKDCPHTGMVGFGFDLTPETAIMFWRGGTFEVDPRPDREYGCTLVHPINRRGLGESAEANFFSQASFQNLVHRIVIEANPWFATREESIPEIVEIARRICQHPK